MAVRAVCGGLFNFLTQNGGASGVQGLLAPLPPSGATPQYSVYFSLAAKQAPRPFIVLHLTETLPAGETLDGVSDTMDGEFQFDSYADDQITARRLSQAVRDSLKNLAITLADGTAIQFYSVALDADDPYELGGGGYVFRSVLRLRAFYSEQGSFAQP